MTNKYLGHKKVISNLTDKYLWQNRELLVFFVKKIIAYICVLPATLKDNTTDN